MTLELRSIKSMLGDAFVVPDYQRGYRWTALEVTALLEDLDEYQQASSGDGARKVGSFYCLQPVVVKPLGELEGQQQWELIDGQQRLTTIFLLLRYLRTVAQVVPEPYRLSYKTRPESERLLRSLGHGGDPRAVEELERKNIDLFHMAQAYRAIAAWFTSQQAATGRDMLPFKLAECLVDPDQRNVRVIWYQLPEGQDPVKAFIRLNVGKIPLTNAELIRALFLRSRNFGAELATRDQLAIGQEWDRIEKKLQEEPFWYFIHGGPSPYATRIDYLFDVRLADERKAGAYGSFLAYQTILRKSETASGRAAEEWRRVKAIALRLEEWHDDRVLYHLVGYWMTVATRGANARTAAKLMVNLTRERNQSRRGEFEAYLKGRIFERIVASSKTHRKAKYDELDNEKLAEVLTECIGEAGYTDRATWSILLLFNVATLLRNAGSNLRFPFDLFHRESWDIEHIRSVASEMPQSPPAQKRWLTTLVDFWTGGEGGNPSPDVAEMYAQAKQLVDAETFDAEGFRTLYHRVLAHYEEDDETEVNHGIGNLTLLDAHTNRSYQNAPFPAKRERILGLDKTGTFVPLCTTNAFLKYYGGRVADMLHWTDDCANAHEAAIKEMLIDFFRKGASP